MTSRLFASTQDAEDILAAWSAASDEAMVTTDLEGRVIGWTRGAVRLYGYSAEEMAGQPVSPLIRSVDLTLEDIYGRVAAGSPVALPEAVGVAKAGHVVSLSVTFTPIRNAAGTLKGVLVLSRDIGSQKRIDAALQASQERWRALLDSAVDSIVVIDARGRIEALNASAERLFGYAEADLLGKNVSTLMPSPYREEHDSYLARYLRDGQPRIIGQGREVTGRRRDGSTFPLHLAVGEMQLDGERKFTGIIHDLSARVALERRLRASEARWRAVVHSAVDAIVVISAEGRIETFNPAAERLFGYKEPEVLGSNVNILMPAPYRDEHDGYIARYLREGYPRIIGTGREVTGLRRDGTTFPVHLSVGEMNVEGERKFAGILHDLTARVRMEEQLREQEALVRLGEMAAVLAHEIKNPLAGIRGAIQVIGGRLAADSPEAAVTREIVNRIDTLAELMKDLLLFARPPRPNPVPVDVAPLVSATAELLTADPALRDVKVKVVGTSPPVRADAGLLQIVFVNLLANGAHAMHGRGTIHVLVRQRENACAIDIRDHGPGIPPDAREKIFTPFFTTKSRGTGLGLATAKRLIEAHHGEISIECPPQGGTTVSIQLPLAT